MNASKYPPSPVDEHRDVTVAGIVTNIENQLPVSFADAVHKFRAGVVALGEALVGVVEIGTTNRGYWVDKLESTTGAVGQSWCMSLVDWKAQVACKALGLPDIMRRNDAGTQAFAGWAEKSGYTIDVADALPGDVFIWQEIADPIHGHAATKHVLVPLPLVTLEGNTSSREATRNGGMVAVHNYDNGTGATKSRRLRCVVSVEKMAAVAWKDVAFPLA